MHYIKIQSVDTLYQGRPVKCIPGIIFCFYKTSRAPSICNLLDQGRGIGRNEVRVILCTRSRVQSPRAVLWVSAGYTSTMQYGFLHCCSCCRYKFRMFTFSLPPPYSALLLSIFLMGTMNSHSTGRSAK